MSIFISTNDFVLINFVTASYCVKGFVAFQASLSFFSRGVKLGRNHYTTYKVC